MIDHNYEELLSRVLKICVEWVEEAQQYRYDDNFGPSFEIAHDGYQWRVTFGDGSYEEFEGKNHSLPYAILEACCGFQNALKGTDHMPRGFKSSVTTMRALLKVAIKSHEG